MNKAHYTPDEVKQLLENLFNEKKRAKQLQQDIANLDAEKSQLQTKIDQLKKLPPPNETITEHFQHVLKNKDHELAQVHLKLLETQRNLANMRASMASEKEKQPPKPLFTEDELEDYRGLKVQIQRLKEMVNSYKRKESDVKSKDDRASVDLAAAQKRVEEAQSKVHYLSAKLVEEQQQHLQQKNKAQAISQQIDKHKQEQEYNVAALSKTKKQYESAQLALKRAEQEIAFFTENKKELTEEISSLVEQQKKLKELLTETREKLTASAQSVAREQKRVASLEMSSMQMVEEDRKTKQLLLVAEGEIARLFEKNREEQHRIQLLMAALEEKEIQIRRQEERDEHYKKVEIEKYDLDKALKQEYAFTDQLKQEKEQIIKDLEESRLHAEQLEKGIHYLRVKSEESKRESEQLGEELALTQDLIKKHHEECARFQEEILSLQQKLEQETFSRNRLIEEQERLQEFCTQLQHQLREMDERRQHDSHKNSETKDEVESLLQEKVHLEQQLTEKSMLYEDVTNENSILKSEREKEKVSWQSRFQEMESAQYIASKEISRLIEENEQFHQQLIQKAAEINDKEKSHDQEKIKIAQLEIQISSLHGREKEHLQTIEGKDHEKVNLLKEIHNLREENQTILAQFNEKDSQVKMAQQHLAKKVKETTLLNEKLEEQREQSRDLLQRIEVIQNKNSELKSSLEVSQQQEKRFEEMFNEAIQSAEMQNKKWEEKYFAIYEKWTETEAINRELRKLEEKHNQMQALLTNLGQVMGTSMMHAPVQTQIPPAMPTPTPVSTFIAPPPSPPSMTIASTSGVLPPLSSLSYPPEPPSEIFQEKKTENVEKRESPQNPPSTPAQMPPPPMPSPAPMRFKHNLFD